MTKTLTILAILLVVGGNMPPSNSQSSDSEVTRLIAILRNPEIRERDPQQVVKAIERLGQMRSTQAVDDLVKLITFKRTYEWERIPGVDTVNEIHPITPGGRYPAIGAIFEIGKPSLPALIEVIKKHDSSSLESENARYALTSIFRDNLAGSVTYLRKAAAKASSPLAAQRLSYAADKAAELVKQLTQQ